jgi:hypothetical protein
MAKEVQIDIVLKSADAANSLKDIKTALKEVNNEIINTKEGSAEFNKLTAAAGQLKDKINDLNDSLKLTQGSGLERFKNSLGQIKEGLFNLDFGKVKAGIGGATQAFGGLGKAIAASGIGLLVLGIVQLIANFDELKKAGGLVGAVFTAIGNIIDGIIQGIKDFSDALGLTNTKLAEAQAAEEEYGAEIAKTNQELGAARRKQLVLTGKLSEEEAARANAKEKFITDFLRIQTDTRIKLKEAETNAAKDFIQKDADAQLALLSQTYTNELITIRNEEAKKKEVKVTKAKETAKEVKQITLDELAALADKELADAEKNAKELDALRILIADESEIEKLQREQKKALEAAERLNASEEDKLNIIKYYSNEILKVEKADAEEITELQKEASEKRLKNKEEQEKKAQEREAQIRQGSIDSVKFTLSAISSLTELFAGKSKAQQKKAFDIQKGVSIAQTTIATFESATNAFKSLSGIPVVGPVLGVAAAAAAVAAGLANIRKISQQKFEGGGTEPAAGSVPSIGATISAGATPNVPSAGPSSFALFGTAGSANNLGGQAQPIQAFVVESDISGVQDRLTRFRSAIEL